MNLQLNRLKRLTPLQLLLVVLFLAAVAIYQSMGRYSQADMLDPTPTPEVSLEAFQPAAAETRTAEAAAVDQPALTAVKASPTAPAKPKPDTILPPGDFDYLVLSLSWSPDYCATSGANDPQQCSIGKKLAFVLHGLWPQYKQGYPSNCSQETLPEEVKAQFAGLYPSDKLFDHEWEKHGTCSGLPADQYLALSQQIKESVVIPDSFRSPAQPFRINVDGVKKKFVESNPNYTAQNLEVFCSGSGRYLKELYVCFSKEGQPTACGTDVHKDSLRSCQSADFLVRNIR